MLMLVINGVELPDRPWPTLTLPQTCTRDGGAIRLEGDTKSLGIFCFPGFWFKKEKEKKPHSGSTQHQCLTCTPDTIGTNHCQ